ncbi:MAG: hypothetical protein Q4F88_06410, partial [Eubacteriales bacterium]|nr:hypothetical protein [Eubacteriales bacterium]
IYGGNKTNGYSFATSKQIDDMHLLLVNMNVSSLTKGYNDIKNLLKYGFENYKGIKIINNDKTFNRTLGALKLGNVYLNFPESLIVSDSSSVTLPIDLKFSDLTKVLSFKETNPNDLNSLGVIKYYYDNVLVGIASIVGFQTKVITNVDITNLSASGYISTAIINNTNQENTIDNPSSPIYRNKDGKLIISASIYKVFIYIIILIICALLFLILRSMFYNYRHNKRRNRK